MGGEGRRGEGPAPKYIGLEPPVRAYGELGVGVEVEMSGDAEVGVPLDVEPTGPAERRLDAVAHRAPAAVVRAGQVARQRVRELEAVLTGRQHEPAAAAAAAVGTGSLGVLTSCSSCSSRSRRWSGRNGERVG